MIGATQGKVAHLRRLFDTGEPMVTRHIGLSTWQGPASEAPDWRQPLPIDLPACEDQEGPSPLETLTAGDLIFFAIGVVGTSIGGTLALLVLR